MRERNTSSLFSQSSVCKACSMIPLLLNHHMCKDISNKKHLCVLLCTNFLTSNCLLDRADGGLDVAWAEPHWFLGIPKNTQLFPTKIQCISSICMSINYVGLNTPFSELEFNRKRKPSLSVSSSQPTTTPNHIQEVQRVSLNSQVSWSPSPRLIWVPDLSMTVWATIGGARWQGQSESGGSTLHG